MRYLLILTCLFLFTGCTTAPHYYGYLQEKEKGVYFFYETRNDSLMPGLSVQFSDMDTTGIYKKSDSEFAANISSMNLKVTGQKTDALKTYRGYPYKTIVINAVANGKYKNIPLEGYTSKNYFRVKSITKDSVFTGFYTDEFEGQMFKFSDNKHIDAYQGWIMFSSKGIKDSVAACINHQKLYPSIFLKVKARLSYGAGHGYGHFGALDYRLDVKQVVEMDSSRNLNDELIKEFDRGYVHDGNVMQSPDEYEFNKEVLYSAALGDSIFELKVKKVSTARIAYDFVCHGKKGDYLKLSGVMDKYLSSFVNTAIDMHSYNFSQYYTYELINNERNEVIFEAYKEQENNSQPTLILFSITTPNLGRYFYTPPLHLQTK